MNDEIIKKVQLKMFSVLNKEQLQMLGSVLGEVLKEAFTASQENKPQIVDSSNAYILLNKDGAFRMYREYDENHYLRFEIGYHPEKYIDPSRKPVLHVHEYTPDNFSDRKARPLTEEEFKKYKKYFKGLKF